MPADWKAQRKETRRFRPLLVPGLLSVPTMIILWPLFMLTLVGLAGSGLDYRSEISGLGRVFQILVLGLIAWTFLIPFLSNLLLMSTLICRLHQYERAAELFSLSYRLLRIGAVFSLMPLFLITGIPGTVYMLFWSEEGSGSVEATIVVGGLFLFASFYYIALLKLRKEQRQLNEAGDGEPKLGEAERLVTDVSAR